jgi:integrase
MQRVAELIRQKSLKTEKSQYLKTKRKSSVPEEGVELFACFPNVFDVSFVLLPDCCQYFVRPRFRTQLMEARPMKARVTLLARINKREFGFPYVHVESKRSAVKFPIEWRRKDGKRVIGLHEFEPDSVMGFYARFQNNGLNPKEAIGKRLMQPLGKDPVAAYMEFQHIDQDFERIERGLAPVNVPADSPNAVPKMTLAQAVAKFERDLTAEGKKRRAVESYVGRARNFLRFFAKRPDIQLDRITADDIRNFLVWLPTNIRRRPGSGGHINNTQRNHLRDAKIMFTRYGIQFPLENKYWPKEIAKRKRKYSIDSVKALLEATKRGRHDNNHWSEQDERDLVHFLLNTGFRDEEVAHAQYGDIHFKKGSINVYPKPEFNWSPKNNKSREQDIDLSPNFIKKMKSRKERYNTKNSDLIFPNTLGKPYLNEGLLNVIRRLTEEAGLEDKASLHQFRKTFGTMVANARGIEQARIWLGHEDVETTQAYLAADEWVSAEDSGKKQQAIFEAVGD